MRSCNCWSHVIMSRGDGAKCGQRNIDNKTWLCPQSVSQDRWSHFMVSNVRSDHTLILTLITVSDGVVGRTTQYKYCPHLETTSTSAILGSPSSIRHVSLSNEDLSSSILNLYRSRFISRRNIRGISLLTG